VAIVSPLSISRDRKVACRWPCSASLTRSAGPSVSSPSRNPATLIFRVTERAALADSLANGEIDFYAIGSDVNLFQRARGIGGAEIRQATEPQYNHITINGGEGSILADPELRKAVVRGINRQAIADALVGQIVPDTTPLGNYLYVQGSENYVDHSQNVSYDPEAARAALDNLGWIQQGNVRSKNGEQLTIDLVSTANNPISERTSH
ncbi:MAG: ABC transporter substrate-binding protein, partial [Pseudonocardiaceae bacterium]